MKFESKKLLKIGGILAAGGLLLAGVGALLGGMNSTYIDSKGIHVLKYEEKKLDYQKIPGKIENLDIDFSMVDLEIILADENAIEAVYYEDSAKPEIQQKGNTTTITSKNQGEQYHMVLMGVGNLHGNSKIKVYLDKKEAGQSLDAKVDNGKIQFSGPRDFKALSLQNHLGSVKLDSVKADSVYVKLDNGDLDISDVETASFTVENHLGKINAANIRAGEGNVKNDNGRITLSDSTYTSLTAEDHLGDMTADRVNIKGGQFKNDNGNITLSGDIQGEINVTAHLGNVNIKTSIPKETAAYQLSTSLGKVEVDGAKYEEAVRDENQSATSRFVVNNNNGNIRLDFGQ